MKRSEINQIISEAIKTFAQFQFRLPPFAYWTSEDWKSKGHEADEIRDHALGWDVTDFGLNNFNRFGLTLFTLRNGKVNDPDCQEILRKNHGGSRASGHPIPFPLDQNGRYH
jgi:D-lyxose ketol-isomerase